MSYQTKSSGDPVLSNVRSSPVAEERIKHQSSFFSSSVNVASIAVLSSIAVNFMLDKIKDRHERNLREEIKDRVEGTLRDAQSRIRSLEAENDSLVSKDTQ